MSQYTTKHFFNDNYVDALTAMVSRLQDKMERQHQQYIDSMEEQEKQHEDSIEQLQQQFNDSMEQQQKYVIKLENTMKEKISTLEEGMIYIFLTGSRLFHAMFLHIEVYQFYSKMTIGCLFRWKRIFTVGRSVGPVRSGPGRSGSVSRKCLSFETFRSTGLEQDMCMYNVSYETKPDCH